MTIPFILGHGVLLLGLFLAATIRPGARRYSAIQRRRYDSDFTPTIDLTRLPDSSALAGIPLRDLLNDRSGPGAVLRDTLVIHPPKHDR